MTERADYQRELDIIDAQICSLAAHRIEISDRLARCNAEQGICEGDDRERRLLARIRKLSAKYGDGVARVYRTVLAVCRARSCEQENTEIEARRAPEDDMQAKINVKRLDERAVLPTLGTPYSAGADLYAVTDAPITVSPGETAMIRTGLAMEIPEGFVGLVFARSGLACKQGLAPANKVGVIDSDYRGELVVALYNQAPEPRIVSCGDRIAQLVIMPYLTAAYTEAQELSDTSRGAGGFGSTGK